MIVIAKADSKEYICKISHSEIEKFMGVYYKEILKELKVNDIVDLGLGYTYFEDTKRALKDTQAFFKSNINTIKAITNAFLLTNEETEK